MNPIDPTNSVWGEIFHLGTVKETSIVELAAYVRDFFENDVKIVFEPERKGEIKRNYSDISKANAMLGFESKTTLEAGIRKVYEWFMRQRIESLRESRVLSGSE